MTRLPLILILFVAVGMQGCADGQKPKPLQNSDFAAKPQPQMAAISAPAGNNGNAPANTSEPVRGSSQVVARLNGKPITLGQLEEPLIAGYGLNILLNIVQLEYVKTEAAKNQIVVTSADIKAERERTLDKQFADADKSERELLFAQFLQQQHVGASEFDLVFQTNAYLRKLAGPLVKDKITDTALEEAFRQLYGETVQIRFIQLANMQEVLEAKRRLAAGEPFQQVAQAMSRNGQTASLGGELPPFSRSANYPQALKDVAFALKEGEVSDAIQFNESYNLVKVEQRIAPRVVKFEDVKEALREDLNERLVDAVMKNLRTQYGQEALRGLIIDQPVLKEQFDAKARQQDQQIRDRNTIREQFERERKRILERAATQQSSSTTEPATESPAPEVARPPATQPQ